MKRVGRWAAGPAFGAKTVAQAMALPTPLYTADELLQLAEFDWVNANRIARAAGPGWQERASALLRRANRREAMAALARESELAWRAEGSAGDAA